MNYAFYVHEYGLINVRHYFIFEFVQDGRPPVKSHKQVHILNKMIFMMNTLCPFVVLMGNSILESNHSGSHK